VQPVNQGIAESLGMRNADGALVDEVQDGGPAAKAGLKAGDVITAVNSDAVHDSRDLARKIGALTPGAKVNVSVLSNGERKTIALALEPMPNDKQANKADGSSKDADAGAPHLGLSLAPAREVAGADAQGLVITGIEQDSPAAEQGLQTGDIILSASGKTVSSVGELRKVLADARKDGRTNVLMRVKSGNGTRFVAVPLQSA
jgi:serine protease Do